MIELVSSLKRKNILVAEFVEIEIIAAQKGQGF